MISDGSFMIISVISLQAVIHGLNSFLTSFTNWYILLLFFFVHVVFLLVLFVLESMPSFTFYRFFSHFFVLFLCPLIYASVIILLQSFFFYFWWLQYIHHQTSNKCYWQKMCSDLLVSDFKGFEKTSCSCYRGRWLSHEATGLEKSAWKIWMSRLYPNHNLYLQLN